MDSEPNITLRAIPIRVTAFRTDTPKAMGNLERINEATCSQCYVRYGLYVSNADYETRKPSDRFVASVAAREKLEEWLEQQVEHDLSHPDIIVIPDDLLPKT
jgi:hypothetical protein